MKFGTVRCYDPRAGRGWITPEDGGRDIAVDQSAVNTAGLGQLSAEQKIGFQIAAGRHGHVAVDLWATWSNR
jgi:CspA family cold shock protein